MASYMRSQLTIIFSQPVWEEGKRERDGEQKGRKGFREREYTFSLDFSGDRFGKLWRCKKQGWSTLQGLHVGTGIVEFRQLREVWVFSYLNIPYLKGHENGFGYYEAGNGYGFRFQRSGTDAG